MRRKAKTPWILGGKGMKDKRYYSFEDVAINEFGMKPRKKTINDRDRLRKQQEKYLGICPYCKQPCAYIPDTNVIACQNEKCNGKKITITNDDGTEKVMYEPYVRVKDYGAEVGIRLFGKDE